MTPMAAAWYVIRTAIPHISSLIPSQTFALQQSDAATQGNSFFDKTATNCGSPGIKLRRLDDYWRSTLQGEQIMVMKMDVQGFESYIIYGAPEMMKAKPPVFIFMEYSPERYRVYGVDGALFLRRMIAYGYTIKHKHSAWGGESDVTLTNGEIERLASLSGEYELEFTHTESVRRLKSGELVL